MSGASAYGCSGPEPSSSGASINFTFYNHSSASISIGDYTTGGSYQGVTSIGAGGSYTAYTHAGYYWQVNNASGACLGEFNLYSSGSITVVS